MGAEIAMHGKIRKRQIERAGRKPSQLRTRVWRSTRWNYSDRVEPVPFHEPSWKRSTFNIQR